MNQFLKLPKVVLVTGASSGIGRACASRFAALGWEVYGTSRSAGAGPAAVQMLKLDVDDAESVRACVTSLLQRAERIDLVVNNAGRAMLGACEETSADEARALFETNVFGVMRVINAVLPTLRAQRSGAIVNVGSLSGFVGVPFHGVYAASKHALAGYTEALRLEVAEYGVRVALIEPAAHRTQIQMQRPRQSLLLYDAGRRRVESIIREQIERGESPERVVDAIVAAACSPAPRLRYRVGAKASLAYWARRLLPDRLCEYGIRREFRLPVGL